MQIEARQLGKRYRNEWIVRDFNYDFQSGIHYAIAGRNGSGKSTLLKLLSGYLSPSTGSLKYSLADNPIANDQAYQHLSYVAPYIELIEELSIAELFRFQQAFKPFPPNFLIKDLNEVLGFAPHQLQQPIRLFSSGMKQRTKLAFALLTPSSLVLLDEPTITLDPSGIAWFSELLHRTAQPYRCCLIASNIEADFQTCTERINLQ